MRDTQIQTLNTPVANEIIGQRLIQKYKPLIEQITGTTANTTMDKLIDDLREGPLENIVDIDSGKLAERTREDIERSTTLTQYTARHLADCIINPAGASHDAELIKAGETKDPGFLEAVYRGIALRIGQQEGVNAAKSMAGFARDNPDQTEVIISAFAATAAERDLFTNSWKEFTSLNQLTLEIYKDAIRNYMHEEIIRQDNAMVETIRTEMSQIIFTIESGLEENRFTPDAAAPYYRTLIDQMNDDTVIVTLYDKGELKTPVRPEEITVMRERIEKYRAEKVKLEERYKLSSGGPNQSEGPLSIVSYDPGKHQKAVDKQIIQPGDDVIVKSLEIGTTAEDKYRTILQAVVVKKGDRK